MSVLDAHIGVIFGERQFARHPCVSAAVSTGSSFDIQISIVPGMCRWTAIASARGADAVKEGVRAHEPDPQPVASLGWLASSCEMS
jgi:hypothetical protein